MTENSQAHMDVERYLAGKLDERQLDAFEERLMWDEALQDDVELTRRLREGMRDLFPDQAQGATGPGTAQATGPGPSTTKPGWPSSARFAMAASVLVAVGAGFMLSQFTRQAGPPGQFANGQVYSLERVRSGVPDLQSLPEVRLPPEDGRITLLVYPQFRAFTEARAELARCDVVGDCQLVWQGETLENVTGQAVAVTLRGDMLSPGVYRLGVYSVAAQGARTSLSEDYFRTAASPSE